MEKILPMESNMQRKGVFFHSLIETSEGTNFIKSRQCKKLEVLHIVAHKNRN